MISLLAHKLKKLHLISEFTYSEQSDMVMIASKFFLEEPLLI